MELVRNVDSPTGNSTLTFLTDTGACWLVKDGTKLYLGVEPGMGVRLEIQSHTASQLMVPVFVANPDGTGAYNIWYGKPVDPNVLTGRKDTWEARGYSIFGIGHFMNGDQQGRPFVVVPAGQGLGFGGGNASTFFVYERTQSGTRSGLAPRSTDTDTATLHTPGSDVLGGGVAIGAGEQEQVEHLPTDSVYNKDAVLIAAVELVPRSRFDGIIEVESWTW